MVDLTARQKADNAIIWIDELFITTKPQGSGRLGDDDNGYCCLGVACSILNHEYDPTTGYSYTLEGITGLHNHTGRYEQMDGEPNYRLNLATLNDHDKLTFKQIAERLKTRARRYFKGTVGAMVAKHYRDAA